MGLITTMSVQKGTKQLKKAQGESNERLDGLTEATSLTNECLKVLWEEQKKTNDLLGQILAQLSR